MRPLPLVVVASLLGASLATQVPAPAEPANPAPANPAPATAAPATGSNDAQRALARGLLDLQKVAAHLAPRDHAFRGSWRAMQPTSPDPIHTVDYTGAVQGPWQLLRLGEHTVLTAGERLRVLREGRWRRTDGDAPDCPLAPHTLLTRLVDADVVTCAAVSLDDRPAQRVHVVWRRKAARPMLDAVSAPHSGLQQLLEGLATQAGRWPDEQLVVDAVLHYDPATKALLTATLRVAWLTSEVPERFEPLPSPAGFPPLTRPVEAAMEFQVTMLPNAAVPWPTIDDATRAELLPPTSTNAAVVTPK